MRALNRSMRNERASIFVCWLESALQPYRTRQPLWLEKCTKDYN